MKINFTLMKIAVVTITLSLISACATTVVQKSNPLYVSNPAQAHATVYFMRPPLVRTRGVADTDLKIELDENLLLELSREEYAMVYVKPVETDVILRNMTFLTGKPNPVEVWRARHMEFENGKTYYIETEFQQEEFRGIYYVPKEIDEATAKQYAISMKPAGKLAAAFPLYTPPPIQVITNDVMKLEQN